MVPFYGQGMNAGLEDVRVLFSFLDKHSPTSTNGGRKEIEAAREKALKEYSEYRKEDAYAINDLALQNYVEMRSSVVDPIYKGRKWLEEKISVWLPGLGWTTKYSRVSFGNERYSEVVRRSEKQGKLLLGSLLGVMGVPIAVGAVGLWLRYRRGSGFLGR
jgi:kynurenine 3-monooxygenase